MLRLLLHDAPGRVARPATRRTITAAACSLLFVGTATGFLGLMAAPVHGLAVHEPIIIDTATDLVTRGESLPCSIQLTGGPAQVTVFSDPPGAVSYEGSMSSSTGVVAAQVAPDAPTGPVTVYVMTEGGSQVASTQIEVEEP